MDLRTFDLKNLPTTKQSWFTLVVGILGTIVGFFQILRGIGPALSYDGDGGTALLIGLLTMIVGIIFISLGNRKVIDQDYFIIFLREFIKKETEKN